MNEMQKHLPTNACPRLPNGYGRDLGRGVAPIEPESWFPSACQNCFEEFSAEWGSVHLSSAELVWICPRCKIPHAKTIEALTDDFVRSGPAEVYLYPTGGHWLFTQVVQKSSLEKINSIRDRALSLGWDESRLYQNRGRFRFPYGDDYGLVCLVYEKVERISFPSDKQTGKIEECTLIRKRRIGEVTWQYIEIICDNLGVRRQFDEETQQALYRRHPFPVGTRIRFQNLDVDQPWIKRIKSGAIE